jgi:arogenate/prephenate dehydratase
MSVAFQGECGAFSELAAVEYFGGAQPPIAMPEFADVFNAVSSGKTRYGVIPIENSMAGSIHQNYDLFLEGDLYIIGELFLRISHYLIANKNVSRRSVKRVFSHPQGLAQCRRYLSRFPKLVQTPFSNTAAAVKKIRDERLMDAAAIASMQAAIDYDMAVLTREIEDRHDNMTRFLILAPRPRRQKRDPQTSMKTSVVFSTKNIPGALFKALSVFALRDIDLYKIESRPVHTKHFEYLFYLDFEGDVRDEAQKNAINHLQEITTLYRCLGSYPKGRIAHPNYRKRK